ncbi:hypothetical protein [Geothrix edaphica]|uniref:Bacterial virulence factor lipase N-terminal domain-containing protein n=1 Tax=Geothrix edaphica TaxID=2927976 RepID=A0ABQ5PTT9_9BACT|nr:hypothetical protein [Geothrix edaphica]GLH65890.1 hypothetical protein GETHED_02540 [Geothrix edaphica]
MLPRLNQAVLGASLLALLACSGGGDSKAPTIVTGPASMPSATTAVFDPANGAVPLPNILATASYVHVDGTPGQLTYSATPSGVAGDLNINPGVPLTPDKALAYVNFAEVGGTHAVSGLNAPIFIAFSTPFNTSTVDGNIKVFKITPDNTSDPASTENNALTFTDISGQFTFTSFAAPTYAANGVTVTNANAWGVYAMPKLPLLPGTRYLYVVTNRVLDSAGKPISASPYFEALKSVTPLSGAFGKLEPIRANAMVTGSTTNIQLSGYKKVMDDLITAHTTTTVTSRSDIALMGRFITTGAGYIPTDPLNATPALAAVRIPVEMSLWAYANNAAVPNAAAPGLNLVDFSTSESRAWSNSVSNFAVVGTNAVPDAASADAEVTGSGSIGSIFRTADANNPGHLKYIPHSSVGQVAWGSFEGADFQMDPYYAHANPSISGNMDTVFGTTPAIYNPGTSTTPGTGLLRATRNPSGVLRGFYHKTRTVPFVIITPAGNAPAGGFPVAIFMHGIGRSKEDVLPVANTLCTAGFAVVSIDQAVHGFPGGPGSLTPTGITTGGGNGRPQAEWASNFFMLPSILTARTNVQTSAFNLWRLQRVLIQPAADTTSLQAAMAAAGKTLNNTAPTSASAGATQFIGQSLGSITGTYFLAGNSSQTGGNNPKGLLSVPGGRLAWILKESPSFATTVAGGLALAKVPTNSTAFFQFFALAQAVADPIDPATMATPTSLTSASRLGNGRILIQEAIGDTVIQNACGNYFVNALAGRKPQFGADPSVGFTHVLRTTDTTDPANKYIFGGSTLADFTTKKSAVAPETTTGSSHPTQGIMQYGTLTSPASHGLLLDGAILADTAAAQRQLAIWVLTGKVADGADATNGYPSIQTNTLLPVHLPSPYGPESLVINYPTKE